MAELPAEPTIPNASLHQSISARFMTHLLFAQFRPEVWCSEDLLEENVSLRPSAWPFIELVENGHVRMIVSERFDNKDSSCHGVHASLPVLIRRVVRRRLPVAH